MRLFVCGCFHGPIRPEQETEWHGNTQQHRAPDHALGLSAVSPDARVRICCIRYDTDENKVYGANAATEEVNSTEICQKSPLRRLCPVCRAGTNGGSARNRRTVAQPATRCCRPRRHRAPPLDPDPGGPGSGPDPSSQARRGSDALQPRPNAMAPAPRRQPTRARRRASPVCSCSSPLYFYG